MADPKTQLVQTIAREVIAVMRQRGMVNAQVPGPGATSAGPRPAGESPAAVRPPIGTCTGDYSKFPELRGRMQGGGVSPTDTLAGASQPTKQFNTSADTQSSPPANEPIPLTGIVTANQLQQAIDSSPDGVATLAADAKLTPLANDFVRQSPEKVRRASATNATGEQSQAAPGDPVAPWLWWIEGQCPFVDQMTRQRASRLRPSSAARSATSLAQVIREIAGGLQGGQIGGALLFVPSAARAVCYANRCAAIRAVVGTCGQAIERGVDELGANVMIIEYPHIGPREMAALVDRMLQQAPTLPPQVQRELADLERSAGGR